MRHLRPKRNSKEKNQRYHAKMRMLQHYGIQITNIDLAKMSEIYRHNPDVVILRRQSNRVVKAVIPYLGTVYPIVYDRLRKQIVTVLKEEYLTPRQRKIFEGCKERLLLKQQESSNKIAIPKDLVLQENEIKEEIEEEDDIMEEEVSSAVIIQAEEDRRLMEEAFNRLPN